MRLLADNLMEFLEMNEITGFTGITFPEGYDVVRARKILHALRKEILEDVNMVEFYPGLTKSKGKVMDPWDVFAPEDVGTFTQAIHLVISIRPTRFDILLTIPNNCPEGWRRLREVVSNGGDLEKFKALIARAKVGHSSVKPNQALFGFFVDALRNSPASINREFKLVTRFWYKKTPECKNEGFKHRVVKSLGAYKDLYGFLAHAVE